MTGHHIPVECEHKTIKGAVSTVTTYKMCYSGSEGSNLMAFEFFNVMVLIGAYYFIKHRRGAWLQGALDKVEAAAVLSPLSPRTQQAADSV